MRYSIEIRIATNNYRGMSFKYRATRTWCTTHQMKDDLYTYADYKEVTELSRWMDVNEKYG